MMIKPRTKLRVICSGCNNAFEQPTKIVVLNIEEDERGQDVITFECPTCGRESKSLVYKIGG
jgi:RNase P subunit RPR2